MPSPKNPTAIKEWKEKLRILKLGKKNSVETRNRISNSLRGHKLSEETKQKISNSLKGKKHSEKTKKKMGLSHKGKKHLPLSEKQKKQISKRAKARLINPENHPNWKGGQKIGIDKRVFIYMPNHPFCNDRYIRRSRLVMERSIGRYLKPEEIVHHINGIKNDDRPENLQLFANNAEHCRFHFKKH